MNDTLDSSAREDLGADFKKALDEGWLPIREVARQTGVNAITLRAWERRYGLIVPQRTPKGHRLFSSEHVQRILTILTWLNRGVAVSQVKPLLDTPQAFSESVENDWQRLRQTLLAPSSSSMSAISTTASTRPWPCIRRAPCANNC
jgi:DNA-binding transcriptional MerR regulator